MHWRNESKGLGEKRGEGAAFHGQTGTPPQTVARHRQGSALLKLASPAFAAFVLTGCAAEVPAAAI